MKVIQLYAKNEPQRPHIYLQDEHAEKVIIRDGDLYEQAEKFAQGLVGKGLKAWETVAVILPTSADFFILF